MDVTKYSKAIAGVIGGAIAAYLMKKNIIIADNLKDAVEVLLSAAVTGIFVFFAPKNRG